jgi:hypothetical protein
MFSFTGAGDFGKGWNVSDAEKGSGSVSAKTKEEIKMQNNIEKIINKSLREKDKK